MEIKTSTKINNIQKIISNKYILIAICLAIICLILSITYVAIALARENIYSNIEVLGVNVGGLSKEDAVNKTNQKLENVDNIEFTIIFEDKTESISLKELDAVYDVNKVIDDAYKIGRQGNIFKRLGEIIATEIKGKKVNIEYTYDKEKLAEICKKLEKSIRIDPKDDWFEVKNHKLTFYYGHLGRGIDEDNVVKDIEAGLMNLKSLEITAKEKALDYKKLDADSMPIKPKDAAYKIENYKNIVFVKEQPGIYFDKTLFTTLLRDNQDTKKSFSMSVNATLPNVTVEDLKAKMFSNTLSSFETNYASSPENRKANVRLAASKINGIILSPGDEFSYNKIVGPRTEDRGFKKAHVYSNGKIIDDFGGGICQVSTTLYNAILKIDLAVTERKNHMFTVSYTQPGMDATVSYGIDDLKFKNNMDWPIKIINNTTPTNVGFTIIGTQPKIRKTIDFRREVVKTIPYTTKEINDPNLEEGQTKVDQNGMSGYVVNVYKITKEAGESAKEEFLHKDTYRSLEKIVRIGTKPKSNNVEPTTKESSEGTVTQPPHQEVKPGQDTTQEVPVIQQDESKPNFQ